MMKKLESLKSSKFEAFEPLSKDAMRFIVGGDACATPGGSQSYFDGTTIKYSADTKDGSTTTYNTTTDKSTATTICAPTPIVGEVSK